MSASDLASTAALDTGALARLRELDPDGKLGVLPRVLTAFEASLVRSLGELDSLPAGGGADTLATIAHTLKSSSASLGALRLSAVCQDVERSARAGAPAAQRHDVQRLRAELAAVLGVVRAMLRS